MPRVSQYLKAFVVCLLVIMLVGKGIFYPKRSLLSFLGKHANYERYMPLTFVSLGMKLERSIDYNLTTYQSIVIEKLTPILPFIYVSCLTPVEAKSVPFLWHNGSYAWYNITKSTIFNNSQISFGTIRLDEEHISGLLRNHRSSYRLLGKLLRRNESNPLKKLGDLSDIPQGRIATFNDVIVSEEGHVLHIRKCVAVINGGCKSPTTWSAPRKQVPVYDRIVSIATYWGFGIWHFLLEAFVGLAHVPRKGIEMSYIHVSSKNSWTMNWLKIAGISENKIITGTVVAKTLIVPEMGRCGGPSYTHIQWLRIIIPSKIPKNPRSIVMIKRTKKRAMQNNELQQLVEKFAKNNNMKFILHADNSLPSIPEQLQRFANASIVIGPHGAGLVHLIASKKGTCVIEFLPPNPNICYMRLSALLGHNYFSVPLYNNIIVNIHKVNKTLHLCKNH